MLFTGVVFNLGMFPSSGQKVLRGWVFLDKEETLLPPPLPYCFICGCNARNFCSHLVAMRSKLRDAFFQMPEITGSSVLSWLF